MSTLEALERCHQCGGAVEVYAKTCPHCRATLTEEKRKTFRQMVADGFVTEEAFEVIEQLLEEGPSPPIAPTPGSRKQITELTLADLEDAPVWEVALDEEGEPGQDEETIRPRDDLSVVDPSEGLFVVAARFTAADGTAFSGYATPNDAGDECESATIITERGASVSFQYGIREPTRVDLDEAYAALEKPGPKLFPIRVETRAPVGKARLVAEIHGFSYVDRDARLWLMT